MGFKFWIKCSIILILLSNHGGNAFAQNASPLGILVQKSFFEKLIVHLNKIQSSGQKFTFEDCITDLPNTSHYFNLELSSGWSNPIWDNTSVDQLDLQLQLSNLKVQGNYLSGCVVDKKTKNIKVTGTSVQKVSVEIENLNLSFTLDTKNMVATVKNTVASANPNATPPKIGFFLADSKTESTLLRSQALKTLFLNGLLKAAGEKTTAWLLETLRGASFVQSAGEILKDNPIWKTGTLVNKGAVSLKLSEPSSLQKYLAFAFNSFQSNSSFVSKNGLELYFNAQFLNSTALEQLTGMSVRSSSPSEMQERARDLLSQPSHWSAANFSRPVLPSLKSDINFIIPPSLPNQAFANIYQERFLKLESEIDLGRQTKGLIADEPLDVSTIIRISPQSAPKMKFEANQFTLEVSDYLMDVGTFIEDRIIPSTQIKSNVTISAALKLDPERQVLKMVLDPSKLSIKLTDVKLRLTDNQVLLFQTISNTVWKEFLKHYTEFEIFPAVINTKDLPIVFNDVTVTESAIILGVNIAMEAPTK